MAGTCNAEHAKQEARTRLDFEGEAGDTDLQSGAAQDPTWRCKAWDEIDVMPKARCSLRFKVDYSSMVNRRSLTRTSAKKGIPDRRV